MTAKVTKAISFTEGFLTDYTKMVDHYETVLKGTKFLKNENDKTQARLLVKDQIKFLDRLLKTISKISISSSTDFTFDAVKIEYVGSNVRYHAFTDQYIIHLAFYDSNLNFHSCQIGVSSEKGKNRIESSPELLTVIKGTFHTQKDIKEILIPSLRGWAHWYGLLDVEFK